MPFRTDKPVDILWSPLKDDEFIAYGKDLYLFKIKTDNITLSKLKIKSLKFLTSFSSN